MIYDADRKLWTMHRIHMQAELHEQLETQSQIQTTFPEDLGIG